MGLSYDLISEFVKITNDKKEGVKEGTVYATVVNSTGGKYVKIDGSDLLTPIDTTTGIEDGERVTVMIKDHKATVTGNITSPSVGKSTVNSLVGTVVDENLVGINADIENLIAKNAYLENVFAQNSVLIDSKIENLVAKDSYLENTYAENATIIDSKIENLEATDSRIENSVIENFQVVDGVVQDLKATNADIKVLNADFAQIKTLVNGNLTSDNILSFNLTSEKVTVDDAFIKDAMIDTISAGKINAGKINTNSVSIGSEDGGMLITGSTQQFMDKNGNVRIQIGKDTSGDFTFILYGENGQGQIINQNGITASAIGDGLIVNNMVSDNAAISGGKLDISSVITEINSDDSTTIKSSKIYLNEQAQSLEIAFNSLKTKVDTIQEVTIQGDLTAIVEQVQSNTSKIEANKDSINTLISQDTVIKKQVTDLQGTVAKNEETLSAKYTTLTQNLDGFKTTVADTYATKTSVTDVVDNIEANYSTTSVMNSAIEQKAQEISASVSSTYATKNQVNTLDNTLRQDYSTTQQMESAINVAKEEINLGVSSIYETKENVESKVTSTLNSAKSYADTKKTEAISTAATDATSKANTAKNDAIKSANNTLTTTIANYYTKTQTDSQINVAKEAINLGVSTTYETKENVQTKVTSTLNSAKSYADTKKTEAISTAATDATSKANTAKQEAIASANNTLSSTISNYYTKSQTDSQINVAKEAINLSVSNTYETKANVESKIKNISVGGTNLAFDTNKGITSWNWSMQTNGGKTITEHLADGVNGVKMTKDANDASGWNYVSYGRFKRDKITPATTYVVSFEMKSNKTFNVGSVNLMQGDSSNTLIKSITAVQNKVTANSTAWSKIIFRLVTLDTLPSSTSQVIYITGIPGSANATHYFRNLKLEVGNTPTTWSPAPEDVTSDITTAKNDAIKSANNTLTSTIANYYTKEQTDSQIKVAKDAINLSVSNTYETKTNVENKVTSTLNSAKSYADTKKTEAISTAASDATSKANTAKNDAIKSANNTLTSTIANYYTKEQTDSQIKVAKDAINLSVSNTYETKTNVQTKINNINIGSVNRLTGTSKPYSMNMNNTSSFTTWDPYFTPDKQTLSQLGFKVGDQITLSFNWTISKNGSNNFVYGNFRTEFVGYASSGGLEYKGVIKNPVATFSASSTSGRSEVTVTLTETNLLAVGLRIRVDNSVLVLTISEVKMEKGNKVTSWSPAPEDVESDITAIESETKSLKQTVSSLVVGTDSINASVKSLEESMVNTTNGLANDISKVQEQVNLAMTSSDVKLEIQKELANGVKKVSTSTGFTFDDKGLMINKSDSEMNTQITEDGMKIYKNSEVMLTANNQGVDAKNLHATTYLIIGGNSRMEDFTEGESKRTAIFWIGQ